MANCMLSDVQPPAPSELDLLEQALGYSFKDRAWLERALTHRSFQTNGVRADYERLEFIGDAVVDLVVADLLAGGFPQANEGQLSKMRASLVNTQALSLLAKKLGLPPYIKLGRGEDGAGGRDRPALLADVMEALVGAVYRDGGFDAAFSLVATALGSDVSLVNPRDPKTELQEVLHALGQPAAEYVLEDTHGPEHAPTFITVVKINGQPFGQGAGATKKSSQQQAAEIALLRLKEESAAKIEVQEKEIGKV